MSADRVALCPECGAPPWVEHSCGSKFAADNVYDYDLPENLDPPINRPVPLAAMKLKPGACIRYLGDGSWELAGAEPIIEFLSAIRDYMPADLQGDVDTCVVCRDGECGGSCPEAMYIVRQVMEALDNEDDRDWWRDEFATDDRTDEPMSGLEKRYNVEKVDDPAGKHDDCRYFVLDPKHDPLARKALRTYAEAADAASLNDLADDLWAWLDDLTPSRTDRPATDGGDRTDGSTPCRHCGRPIRRRGSKWEHYSPTWQGRRCPNAATGASPIDDRPATDRDHGADCACAACHLTYRCDAPCRACGGSHPGLPGCRPATNGDAS